MIEEFRLDGPGVREVLRSPKVRNAVHNLAEDVAAEIRVREPEAVDVAVDDYTTDRAASSVTVRDARGRLWQVRDGLMTRAAASAGLEVRDAR